MVTRCWSLSQQGHLQPHSKSKAWQLSTRSLSLAQAGRPLRLHLTVGQAYVSCASKWSNMTGFEEHFMFSTGKGTGNVHNNIVSQPVTPLNFSFATWIERFHMTSHFSREIWVAMLVFHIFQHSGVSSLRLCEHARSPREKTLFREDFLWSNRSCLDIRQNIRSRVPASCRIHGFIVVFGARHEFW